MGCGVSVHRHCSAAGVKCAHDPDIIACLIAQVPLEQWGNLSRVSKMWAAAVKSKSGEATHCRLIGLHSGCEPDRFSWPTCTAEKPRGGGLLVTEAWSHTVKVYDQIGRPLLTIGGPGRALGKMIYPTGVAVDQQTGHVYVVDSGNHRVQKFTEDGEPLGEMGSAGSSDAQFMSPRSIVCVGQIGVIISDGGKHRLSVWSRELEWRRNIASGIKGAGPKDFNTPEGLAAWHGNGPLGSKSTLLFVADSENHRVQVLELPNGQVVRTIGKGTSGSRPGEFARPGGVAIDASDRLLVSECRGQRIQLLTLLGEPLQIISFALGGTASPVLNSVCCPATDPSRAYACDFANHRVAVLELRHASY